MPLARSGLSSARSGLQRDFAEQTPTRYSFASLFAKLRNLLLFPASAPPKPSPRCAIRCQERLGGLLKLQARRMSIFSIRPFFAGFAFQLLPVAFDNVPIHLDNDPLSIVTLQDSDHFKTIGRSLLSRANVERIAILFCCTSRLLPVARSNSE